VIRQDYRIIDARSQQWRCSPRSSVRRTAALADYGEGAPRMAIAWSLRTKRSSPVYMTPPG
jgi:hypothetical protein